MRLKLKYRQSKIEVTFLYIRVYFEFKSDMEKSLIIHY